MPTLSKPRAKINWNASAEAPVKFKGKKRRINGRMDATSPSKSAHGYSFVFSDDISDWRSKAAKNAKPLF